MSQPKVVLVNPASKTFGYSFITPRWLYVLAGATPPGLVGDSVIVDEAITRFDPMMVGPGDLVGVGITTGNCIAGYRVLREAKRRGATVVFGGIHASIFPEEPIRMGADAVVTGDGDIIWSKVVSDALAGRLQKKYDGGKVSGELLQPARWDLLDPTKYMFASVQTVVGCPENCTFCSVWTMNGREPRQRPSKNVIAEMRYLYQLGCRFVVFGDDNFNPGVLGRIARETSPAKRAKLERIREERLAFFREYGEAVPQDLYAFTQMTSEIVSDPEYLRAMHDQMRIRAALIGVESFSEEGLKAARKEWNPVGQKMVDTIRAIQAQGIYILTSIICGLETDTRDTIRTMQEFARSSRAAMAQFTLYSPYPGTVDFLEMMKDRKCREEAKTNPLAQAPKHRIEIIYENFWTDPHKPAVLIKHPNLTAEELIRYTRESWKRFYSPLEIFRRANSFGWPWKVRLWYLLGSLAFNAQYAGYGIAADSVKEKKIGWLPKLLLKTGIGFYNRFFRKPSMLAIPAK